MNVYKNIKKRYKTVQSNHAKVASLIITFGEYNHEWKANAVKKDVEWIPDKMHADKIDIRHVILPLSAWTFFTCVSSLKFKLEFFCMNLIQ